MTTPLTLVIAVAAAAVIFCVWVFNRLTSLNVRASNAWSDIDVQLKSRAYLVPALVETVRGYAAHESTTLERAVAARQHVADGPASLAERSRRESQVGREIHHLIGLAEAYPNLKADEMFLSLQQRLVEVEDHLQSARRYYNAVVRDFHTVKHQVPHVVVASLLRFKDREFFELDDAMEAANPAVDLEGPRR
jgi:LemA protein